MVGQAAPSKASLVFFPKIGDLRILFEGISMEVKLVRIAFLPVINLGVSRFGITIMPFSN